MAGHFAVERKLPWLVSVIAFVGALVGFPFFYRMRGGGRHTPVPTLHAGRGLVLSSISGLVVEYIVAIDVTRVRFPADAFSFMLAAGTCAALCDTALLLTWAGSAPKTLQVTLVSLK